MGLKEVYFPTRIYGLKCCRRGTIRRPIFDINVQRSLLGLQKLLLLLLCNFNEGLCSRWKPSRFPLKPLRYFYNTRCCWPILHDLLCHTFALALWQYFKGLHGEIYCSYCRGLAKRFYFAHK